MRFVAVIVLAAATTAAAAQSTTEDLLRQSGLFGAWASDCNKPAAPDNAHVTIGMPKPGQIVEEDNLGPDYVVNRYEVLSAKRDGNNRITIRAVFRSKRPSGDADKMTDVEERQTLTFVIRDRTRRTVFTQVEGGEVRVKDGVVVSHGSKTPLLKKCE